MHSDNQFTRIFFFKNVFKKQPPQGFCSSTVPEPFRAEPLPPPQLQVSTRPGSPSILHTSPEEKAGRATKPFSGLQDCLT